MAPKALQNRTIFKYYTHGKARLTGPGVNQIAEVNVIVKSYEKLEKAGWEGNIGVLIIVAQK